MYILLSNNCLVLPAVVMQQQEEISRNHVPYLFAVSVRIFITCFQAATCETGSIHAAETKMRKQEKDLKYEESPFLAATGLPVFTKGKTTGVNGSYTETANKDGTWLREILSCC